jgi:hypothetical protein
MSGHLTAASPRRSCACAWATRFAHFANPAANKNAHSLDFHFHDRGAHGIIQVGDGKPKH